MKNSDGWGACIWVFLIFACLLIYPSSCNMKRIRMDACVKEGYTKKQCESFDDETLEAIKQQSYVHKAEKKK